jgi:hypothetical protein
MKSFLARKFKFPCFTSQVSPFIDFKGDVIQNVTEYKFLGCLFKSNGNFRHSLEELAKKARKVLSDIIRRSSANAREPTLEFKSSEGLHSSVLKLALRSFMKILKRVGLIEFHTQNSYK